MGKFELIPVSTFQLALVETGAVVGVDSVAVSDEEDHITGLVCRDVLELLFNIADPLVSLSPPIPFLLK